MICLDQDGNVVYKHPVHLQKLTWKIGLKVSDLRDESSDSFGNDETDIDLDAIKKACNRHDTMCFENSQGLSSKYESDASSKESTDYAITEAIEY